MVLESMQCDGRSEVSLVNKLSYSFKALVMFLFSFYSQIHFSVPECGMHDFVKMTGKKKYPCSGI